MCSQRRGKCKQKGYPPKRGQKSFKYRKPAVRDLRTAGVVGMAGFEPAASCSQSRRATKLRYIPMLLSTVKGDLIII